MRRFAPQVRAACLGVAFKSGSTEFESDGKKKRSNPLYMTHQPIQPATPEMTDTLSATHTQGDYPMSNKILVIISTADEGKALTGILYATNTLKNGWLEDVKLILFGPAEDLALQSEAVQQALQGFLQLGQGVMACKFVADKADLSDRLAHLGLNVDYVGAPIGQWIREGYVPMVW